MSLSPLSRRAALGLVAALAVLNAPPATAQGAISGLYRADGRNPDGSPYSGTAQITETGNTVSVNWQVGNRAYSGAGYRDGSVVVINWGDTSPVVYVVMSNGELHGTWANGTALERLSR